MLALSACRAEKTAPDDRALILSSFYPIHLAVRNIARDVPGVRLANLTQPGSGCLHDHALTPDEMVRLERSRVLVISGLGLESFLDSARVRRPGLRIIDASSGIQPIVDTHGVANPHVWVSIRLAMVQAQNIANGLCQWDPPNAPRYRANAQVYLEALRLLHADMAAALRSVPRRDLITFHEAFPYFAREFGLRVVGVIEREPGSEPSAGELADSIALVRRTGVRALFAEPQYSPRAIETIARATGVPVRTLDPVVSGPDEDDAYLRLMRANLIVLKAGLE